MVSLPMIAPTGSQAGKPREFGVLYIEGAHDLQHADVLDGQGLGSDAYAVVWLNDRLIGRTEAVEDSLNPVWDAKFRLPLAPAPVRRAVHSVAKRRHSFAKASGRRPSCSFRHS